MPCGKAVLGETAAGRLERGRLARVVSQRPGDPALLGPRAGGTTPAVPPKDGEIRSCAATRLPLRVAGPIRDADRLILRRLDALTMTTP